MALGVMLNFLEIHIKYVEVKFVIIQGNQGCLKRKNPILGYEYSRIKNFINMSISVKQVVNKQKDKYPLLIAHSGISKEKKTQITINITHKKSNIY